MAGPSTRKSTRISAATCRRATTQHADSDLAPSHGASIAQAKARQSNKIRELRLVLQSAGLLSLDQQARALGLCRSSAWKILRGDHKASGLTAMTVERMLSSPQLPPLVRTKLIEYLEERADGRYGHSQSQVRRFLARIVNTHRTESETG